MATINDLKTAVHDNLLDNTTGDITPSVLRQVLGADEGIPDNIIDSLDGADYTAQEGTVGYIKNKPNPYELPVAASNTLGGIKVGSGLLITDGVLSNNYSYSLPISSASVLGGVKIGANIDVDANGVISVASPSGGGSLQNAYDNGKIISRESGEEGPFIQTFDGINEETAFTPYGFMIRNLAYDDDAIEFTKNKINFGYRTYSNKAFTSNFSMNFNHYNYSLNIDSKDVNWEFDSNAKLSFKQLDTSSHPGIVSIEQGGIIFLPPSEFQDQTSIMINNQTLLFTYTPGFNPVFSISIDESSGSLEIEGDTNALIAWRDYLGMTLQNTYNFSTAKVIDLTSAGLTLQKSTNDIFTTFTGDKITFDNNLQTRNICTLGINEFSFFHKVNSSQTNLFSINCVPVDETIIVTGSNQAREAWNNFLRPSYIVSDNEKASVSVVDDGNNGHVIFGLYDNRAISDMSVFFSGTFVDLGFGENASVPISINSVSEQYPRVKGIVTLSSEEFNNIPVKDPNTLYLILD